MNYYNQHNPILPVKYHVPDCEAHVMSDGKLYIYGSFDNRDDVYCSSEYHVISTPDMKQWTLEEESSLSIDDISWANDPNAVKYPGIDWTNPTPFIRQLLLERADDKKEFEKEDNRLTSQLLFAPDCMEKNGKYYLFFCMQDDSEGVAVSDSPRGPFKNCVQFPCGGIDPAVLLDNGAVYYYWGQLFLHGVKLNDNMTGFNPEEIADNLITEEDHFFHEGSSIRRIGDKYYMLYTDMERGKPTSIGYSIGDSPLGPFEYKGIIIDNAACDPASWNNHGSMECFNGQWYVFYHRSSRNSQLYRRLCIEKINVLPDGTIPEVKMTSQGIGDPFQPNEVIKGYQACEVHGGCYIAADPEYEESLVNLIADSNAVFRYVKSDHAFSNITMKAAGSGKIRIKMIPHRSDHSDAIAAGELEVAETKCGDSIYSTFSAPICAPAGEYELILEIAESMDLRIAEIILK